MCVCTEILWGVLDRKYCVTSCFTWTVAAQHPWLDERGWDRDLIKQAAVVGASFLPGPSDQHLNSTLRSRTDGQNKLISHP